MIIADLWSKPIRESCSSGAESDITRPDSSTGWLPRVIHACPAPAGDRRERVALAIVSQTSMSPTSSCAPTWT
ncbi:hypothetical protein AWC05_02635 [Mycobacterium florentinum]|uniref:Uncharacterized protein n=1 Tax=Mycobacterium florentinum TaxID=292462 RepID=A0A1X1TWX0_MYCFL|nr:hypothetical protein [Mycobacterium florentinum]MCV7413510.1 hypothetical protein [Mycobacterium florentinum]ORV49086.1 hypothetical protein AWC05_02635 [Mycobacterium florentinum]